MRVITTVLPRVTVWGESRCSFSFSLHFTLKATKKSQLNNTAFNASEILHIIAGFFIIIFDYTFGALYKAFH